MSNLMAFKMVIHATTWPGFTEEDAKTIAGLVADVLSDSRCDAQIDLTVTEGLLVKDESKIHIMSSAPVLWSMMGD